MKREEKQYIPILAKWVEISEMENFITLRVKLQVGSDSYILKPFKQIHTNLQIHTHRRRVKHTDKNNKDIYFYRRRSRNQQKKLDIVLSNVDTRLFAFLP